MNRQAFTFLTLFTLVLMLAVYYVTLPLEDPTVSDENLIVSQQDDFEDYKQDLLEKHDTLISDNESVISNSESTLNEKLEALQIISDTEKTNTLETAILTNLSSCGFEGCFVEVEDEVTRVVCPKKYVGKNNAVEILEEVYRFIEEQNLVEITFE